MWNVNAYFFLGRSTRRLFVREEKQVTSLFFYTINNPPKIVILKNNRILVCYDRKLLIIFSRI